MEKIDLLVWDPAALEAAERLEVDGLRRLAVHERLDLPDAPLVMGRGAELAGYVSLWVDTLDVWREVVDQVPADAYLVTESVVQAVDDESLLVHLTWFPKPARLTDDEFFHGWHDVHTPSSAALHPLRRGYVRDAVARRLTPESPPTRAVVAEYFDRDVYLDPARLFGPPETLERTMEELPGYADQADISSCPVGRRPTG